MVVKGYDENGKLAFRQEFTVYQEAIDLYEAEKAAAASRGIFYLELLSEGGREYAHFAR